MSVQLSTSVRNARLDAIETTVGTAAVLKMLSGSPPADCATANSGVVLASMNLPSDYLAAAASGSKSMLGTWSTTASGAGVAGYFRIYASNGTTCHMQGTITATGGGGDMTLDNTLLVITQSVSITSFTLTDGNA